MLYETPQELRDEICFCDREFPSHEALSEFLHRTSRNHCLPIAACHTGDRTYATYHCHFGGRVYGCRTSKTGCPFFLKYRGQKTGDAIVYSLVAADLMHNHRVDRQFVQAHCNCYSEQQISEICQQQALHIPPGRIRANLDITTNSDIFYNIRRSTIANARRESLEQVLHEMKCNDFVSDITIDENGNLIRAAIMHTTVSCERYSADIMFTDTTSTTNIYGMGLQVMVVWDAESHTQLYGFGYLSGQDELAYESFFKSIKNMSGRAPRVIVIDRCEAQFNALVNVYPETYVVFCLRHLAKNLETHFRADSDIVTGFRAIQKNVLLCDEYMAMVSEILNTQDDFPGRDTLQWMMIYADHWLPSRLIQHGVLFDWTTNRAEGWFGTLKQRYGFTLFTLAELTKNIITCARCSITNSLASIPHTMHKFGALPCEERELIGACALEIIAAEVIAFMSQRNEDLPCNLCLLRSCCPALALPCRHVISKDTVFRAAELPDRYLREVPRSTIDSQNSIHTGVANVRSSRYTDLMNQFAPFAAVASKNSSVNQIIQESLDRLRDVMSELNPRMPPTITVKGRFSLHPAHNVPLGGARKTKRIYRCAICGELGHNKSTCPRR